MMSRTLYFINFVLIVLVIFLAAKDYEEWTRTDAGGMEGTVSKAKTGAVAPISPSLAKSEPVDRKNYKSISEKNPFSPDRKEFPIPLGPGGPGGPGDGKKPLARPNITLYGIVLADEFSSAVINNPARRPEKGERDTISVKIGDRVGEYRVANILGDRINLEGEGDSFDVLLYDPAKPKSRPMVTPPPPPAARPSPTPATPARPFTPPSAGVSRPSPSPPAGIGQAPLPPPGREVPRASTLRQRRDTRRPVAPPSTRIPVIPPSEAVEEDEEDEEEE
jgi:hypothetical protein